MVFSSFSLSRRWILKVPGWIGWGVLATLIFFAARERFHLAPVAIATPDSWGWLATSLDWIGGLGFREHSEREWLYEAFVAGCLRSTGSFASYTHIQQVLGLVAGILMWMTWRRWVSFFPKSMAIESVTTFLGLYVIAFYLFSPNAMAFELSIQPEAILVFVAFLQLFCISSFCKYRWQEQRSARAIFFGAFSILFAYALFVLKPNWLLAVPATLLPIFLGFFGQKPHSLLPRFLVPLLGFVLIATTLWLPEKIFFVHTIKTRLVLPLTLFTIHADIIRDRMAQELAAPQTSLDRRAFLQSFLPVLDREMRASWKRTPYKLLGFDPDYLMYCSSIVNFLTRENRMSREDISSFATGSFLDAVIHRPFAYIRKVLRQESLFLFPDQKTFIRKYVDLQRWYSESLSAVPNELSASINPATQSLYRVYIAALKHGAVQEHHRIEGGQFFKFFHRSIAGMYWVTFPLIVAFAILLLASLYWDPLAFLQLPGLVALVIFAAPAGMALTISLAHSLENDRYRMVYGPLLLFALAVLLIFVLIAIAYSARAIVRANP